MPFKLKSDYIPTGDQPTAIEKLTEGIKKNVKDQVLLGVTGSGKTFTMAHVVQHLNRPTLVISHNKTLAGQLYQEFRDFFPENAVSYFVSYYDYYQPEAYIPATDTYIEKETDINEEIDKLRLAATTNLLTRSDTLVVASVSCIYNIGSPREYGKFILELANGMQIQQKQITNRLVDLQYERSDYDFKRGSFRIRGETVDVFLAYQDFGLRMIVQDNFLKDMFYFDPLTGEKREDGDAKTAVVYPAKHYMADPKNMISTFNQIQKDMAKQVQKFKKEGKHLEAHRIAQRVNYDLEMIQEIGYVNGIENYSRYFDGRKPGDPPYTLFDYYHEMYGKDWILIIDESHMTIPQVRGMYNGDRARKETLINFGFRLPAALDNRPYQFDEFKKMMPNTVYVSATPVDWELKRSKNHIVEQLIRPTGLIDPIIEVRPVQGQIADLTSEIVERVKKGERTLVTTLTKRMAEDLSRYLNKNNSYENSEGAQKHMKIAYLHSDIDTLDRQDILEDLRRGEYDVLVGINLLREGLDLPEVSLVAILDADKEGFLRSRTSLVQTMGRAARHQEGKAIMYADRMTDSMKFAIDEVNRRREIQLTYNKKYGITPTTIIKPIREKLVKNRDKSAYRTGNVQTKEHVDFESLTPREQKQFIKQLQSEMREAARNLDFETAAKIRDRVEKYAETR
ncbi:excinuclease ABC subunit UvrB [Candidatus Roizmanbacteria bacterium]|nr:excinuclease ABC subunit UvrB [Candidatus Roizmanbacteria bacterium]